MPYVEIISERKLTLTQARFLSRGSKQWDALAYDKVSPSPAKQVTATDVKLDRETFGTEGRVPLRGNRESLATAKCDTRYTRIAPIGPATGNPPVGTNVPIRREHVRFMATRGAQGVPHPELNHADWFKANSTSNLLNPTALHNSGICACSESFDDCCCSRARYFAVSGHPSMWSRTYKPMDIRSEDWWNRILDA